MSDQTFKIQLKKKTSAFRNTGGHCKHCTIIWSSNLVVCLTWDQQQKHKLVCCRTDFMYVDFLLWNIHSITSTHCDVACRHPKHALQHARGILGRDWSAGADRYEVWCVETTQNHPHAHTVSSCKYLEVCVSAGCSRCERMCVEVDAWGRALMTQLPGKRIAFMWFIPVCRYFCRGRARLYEPPATSQQQFCLEWRNLILILWLWINVTL